MTRALLTRLRRDKRGATIIEFAFVLPVMCMLIMGLSDLAYQSYVQVILSGAMQKAGRDSTIQGADGKTDKIDAMVIGMVRGVARTATYTTSRKSYAAFGDISAEPFDDVDRDGVYDRATECFTDINANNNWDADRGVSGQGGANDVVLYTMRITYPRLFPMWTLFGWPTRATLAATTVLKNQPYAQQNTYSKQVCPP